MENYSFWLAEFHFKVLHGSVFSVKEVLERKPPDLDIDEKNDSMLFGFSALEYLVYQLNPTARNRELIKIILQNGADPLQIGKEGIVMSRVFSVFESEMIMEFLKHIKDIDTPIDLTTGANALHQSAKLGNITIMQYCLLRGADPNRVYNDNFSAIYWAMKSGQKREKMVNLLMKHGADINFQTAKGHTPLHTAVSFKERDCVDLIKLLLTFNPDPNIKSKTGFTPLYLALYYELIDMKMIEALLRHGSDPDYPTEIGGNSLHIIATSSASHWKIPDVADMLIKYGATVNHQDHVGNTPLHYAIYRNAVNIADNLVKNGADLHIKNRQGKNPMTILHACEIHTDMAAVIVKHIMLEAFTSNTEICELFATIIDCSSKLRKIKKECRIELKHMKSRLIADTNLNFLNILASKYEDLLVYLKNDKTLSVLDKSRAKDYDNYGEALRKKIRAAIRRKRLENFFSDSMCSSNNVLPINCWQNIADYLSDADLEDYKSLVHMKKPRKTVPVNRNRN